MKKVAILQSNYIPWKGYFDIIAMADELIIYDDMQYTRRDWRNRNQIKTSQGVQWLTVPVKVKGKYLQTIRDTEIDGSSWHIQHWKSICINYKKANYFEEVSGKLENLYKQEYRTISELNIALIEFVCQYLGISTRIKKSWEFNLTDGKTERLIDLCQQTGATEYISGPAAKDYIDPIIFNNAGIALTWFNYEGYPEYRQLWGEFTHHVSILDLLFNCGKSSPNYLRFVKK
jgi:hypothetical protein